MNQKLIEDVIAVLERLTDQAELAVRGKPNPLTRIALSNACLDARAIITRARGEAA